MFHRSCDDLDTFPVEVRDGDILLLKEGLLSEDNWTLSKAIAIMLAKGVSEQDTLKLVVQHLGRHIATERGPNEGGRELAMMVNGVKVARHYGPDDRLIPFMMAATGASGTAGDRPAIQPLPPPVTWGKLEHWIRLFSADKAWEGIEKCLITARRLRGQDERIFPLLYECAMEPFFLGHTQNLPNLRAAVRRRMEELPKSERPPGYFALPHARLLVAREAGYDNWTSLVEGLQRKAAGQGS
jgi:hypothetical protein